MSERVFWQGFLVGGAIFALAAWGASTERLRVAEQRLWQLRLDAVVADQRVLAEALRSAVPNHVERALVGAQAVHDVKGGQR